MYEFHTCFFFVLIPMEKCQKKYVKVKLSN